MHDPADFSLRIEVAPPEHISDDAATTRPYARSSAAELDELSLPPLPRLPGVNLPTAPLRAPRPTLAALREAPMKPMATARPTARPTAASSPVARIVPRPSPRPTPVATPVATPLLRPIPTTAIMTQPEPPTNVYVLPDEPEALPPPPAAIEPSGQEWMIARAEERRMQRRARGQKRIAWAQATLRRFGFLR